MQALSIVVSSQKSPNITHLTFNCPGLYFASGTATTLAWSGVQSEPSIKETAYLYSQTELFQKCLRLCSYFFSCRALRATQQTSMSARWGTPVSTSAWTRPGATGASAPPGTASWPTARLVKVRQTPKHPSRLPRLSQPQLWSPSQLFCSVSTDIDECLEENIQCGANRMCFNMRGSYQCIDTPCPPNYQRDSLTG